MPDLNPALLDGTVAVMADLDGTLVNSDAPVRRAWDAFARRHGLHVEDVLRYAHGRPSRETVAALASPGADLAAEAAILEETEVRDTDGVFALPGAHDVLRSRHPVAIVTSCSRALAEARLRACGLPIPEILVGSDGLERGKPHPECYLIGARLLGVEPAHCLVLEDAPAGIAAGIAAGARVLAVRTTHGDDDLTGAHVVVDDLRAIISP